MAARRAGPVPSPSVPPTRLLVIRHGQSEWNALGLWQGQADPALSPLGRRQAADAATRLVDAGIEVMRCSPLRRAAETAEIIAAALGLEPPVPEPDLVERDVGEWSGLTRAEIEQRWPDHLVPPRKDPPGGETWAGFQQRVERGIARLLADHPGQVVSVVAHGGVIRAIERALGIDAGPIPNLVGWWIDDTDDGLRSGERLELVDPDDRNQKMPLAP